MRAGGHDVVRNTTHISLDMIPNAVNIGDGEEPLGVKMRKKRLDQLDGLSHSVI
jgi:hypothetical protein